MAHAKTDEEKAAFAEKMRLAKEAKAQGGSDAKPAETTASPSLVEITLKRPFYTNGVTYGFEEKRIDGKKVNVFTGKAKVTQDVADDLLERDARYDAYEASLHRDGGKSDTQVDL